MVDLYVIGAYLALMLAVGFVVSRMNRDTSDYFRSGCRGTWWLVGVSNWMAAFSAWTFTGGAGAAFEAGWSTFVGSLGGILGVLLITIPFTAVWFRQLRATTAPEVIRARFGPTTQQFYAWIDIIGRILVASLHLFGAAIFVSSVFGVNVHLLILVFGLVVLLYSTTGGSWAVMSTDFLQGLILISMTVLLTVLCLQHVGGVSGLLSMIHQKGLESQFRPFKAKGDYPGNLYTGQWVLAMVLMNFLHTASLNGSPRYFACKDGREARRSAVLGVLLGVIGMIVFWVPPVVARLVAAPEVLGTTSLGKPAESAYAVISMKLLPPGLMGVMVVAMLAATMSTMDTGLNRNAAIITQDIYPALSRLLKRPSLEGKRLLRLGQVVTVFLGLIVISLALYFAAHAGQQGIFGIMLNISATVHLPLVIPMALCIFVRRVPRWTAMVTVAACLIPAFLGFFSKQLFGQGWSYQQKVFITAPVGIGVFLLCGLFWKREPDSYRRRVAEFFRKMHTPVDFTREVGQASDFRQLRTVGIFTLIVGLFIGLLVFLPPDWVGRMQILIVAGTICAVGILMVLAPALQSRFRKTGEPSDSPRANNDEQANASRQETVVPVTEQAPE